jgi:hypothetical protein
VDEKFVHFFVRHQSYEDHEELTTIDGAKVRPDVGLLRSVCSSGFQGCRRVDVTRFGQGPAKRLRMGGVDRQVVTVGFDVFVEVRG